VKYTSAILLLLLCACNKSTDSKASYEDLSGSYQVRIVTRVLNTNVDPDVSYRLSYDTTIAVTLNKDQAIVGMPGRQDTLLADDHSDTLFSYQERPSANSHNNYTMRLKVNREKRLEYYYTDQRLGYYWKDTVKGSLKE